MIGGEPTSLNGHPSPSDHTRPARRASPLVKQTRALIARIKDLGDRPSPRAVHELRTTIRRVETLLGVDERTTGVERKVWKQLDRVRRRAGKIRDLDVQLKALRSVPKAVEPAACGDLREALRKSRQKREKRLARTLGNERDRGLVKRLRRVIVATPAPIHRDTGRALVQVLGAFEDAWRNAQPLDASNLHAFRIATKRLRYRAEALLPDAPAETALRALKRVQDAIGEWHDWCTLIERAEEVLGDDGTRLCRAMRSRADKELANALTVTERVARRLRRIRPASGRKSAHPMPAADAGGPTRSAGASA